MCVDVSTGKGKKMMKKLKRGDPISYLPKFRFFTISIGNITKEQKKGQVLLTSVTLIFFFFLNESFPMLSAAQYAKNY